MTDIAEVRRAVKEASESLDDLGCIDRDSMAARRRIWVKLKTALDALDRLERSAAPERKRWRHVNSGALVTEIGRGLYASGDSVDDITPIVFYRHDIGGWGSACWARPIKKFEDQFVEVPPAQTEEGKPEDE
jgi:hypothetical protein